MKPSLPRYQQTWDVDIVFKYLKTFPPVNMLSFRFLSYKLVTLLLLLTGQRIQTIHSLKLDNIKLSDNSVYIEVTELLKTSKPGSHIKPIELPAFSDDTRLCIVTVLKEYITRTQLLRKTSDLIISCVKPYQRVSKAIGRWLKTVLQLAGVNINIFKPHSTRSASTSAALRFSTPVDTILKAAGWAKESTFRKFYNKPVSMQSFDDNFSVKLLRGHDSSS